MSYSIQIIWSRLLKRRFELLTQKFSIFCSATELFKFYLVAFKFLKFKRLKLINIFTMCYRHNKSTALCKLIIRELGQKKNVLKKIVIIPSIIDFSLSIL